MLFVILAANAVVFVGEQRRDTYYRNDPSEYDLVFTCPRSLLIMKICFMER